METIYYDDKDIVDQMMQILGIKQGDEESIEEFTKRYNGHIMLWNGELPEEEKRIWYVLGLKRQYLYEIEALLPETYDQAKQLALIVEAQMKGVKKEVKNVVSDRDIKVTSESEKNKIKDFPRWVKANGCKTLIEKMCVVYNLGGVCRRSVDCDAKVVIKGKLNISVVCDEYVIVVIRIKRMFDGILKLWYDVVKGLKLRRRIFVCNNLEDRGKWMMNSR
ncbi:8259_t:CDS:2 [Dentiscutata erythropus]|uniref:8259_t:CDS:1 n=1 Tax=Dentiscutata erythropus TaxID=1348616 RepID=A0A9N9C1L3_9GLOM|nr:8259_t:CDS:2 [Dentiscutata erythropus]